MKFIRPDIIAVAILGCTAAALFLVQSSSGGGSSNTIGNFLSVLVVSPEGSPRMHFLQSSIAANLSASGDSADVGRLLILYHITAGEEWQYIVEDQVMKLMFSGLYAQLSRVHCTVSSTISNGTAQVSEVLSGYGSKFSVIEVPDDFQLSQSIATVSNLTYTDRVLFLSTYGADAARNSTAYEEVYHRRIFMEYEMIKNYRQHLDELLKCGIVGINDSLEASENNGTYFWWATGKHLLQNPDVFARQLTRHRPRTRSGFARNYLKAKSSDTMVEQRIYQKGIALPVPLEQASYIDSATPIASPCVTRQPDDQPTNGTKPSCRIFIFHHIYVDNNWREIVMDQLAKIVFSGLYDRVTAVYSTLSGRDGTAIIAAEHLITSFGAKFFVLDHQLNSQIYERLTMYQIKSHVSADDVILYIHSKGLHATCLDLLDPSGLLVDKYDTVGINWIQGHHYSGNFWWSTGRHWKSLPDIIGPGYLDPENFIHLNSPRIAALWDTGLSGMGHYKADYYPREYSQVYNVSVLAHN